MEKIKLQKAGLGRKRISFDKDSNAAKVKAKLEEIYARLVSGGGFEILRSGLSPKDLYLVTPPLNIGYTVHFLRDSSGLGQAIAYIRPVQADLDSSSLEMGDHAPAGDAPENKDMSIAPTVKCLNCSVQIPMNSIRNHIVECGMDNHHKQFKKASFSGTPLMSELHEMFPDLHDTAKEEAVRVCEGDIEVSVSSLLDHSKGILLKEEMPNYGVVDSTDSDSENLQQATAVLLQEEQKKTVIEEFRDATIVSDSPVFRVYVNRMASDFANDI
ncbi:uncharacterized protein LOC124453968 isoform X2 [Xenia sp. Carnegie-2017]|uniref:uncharacterized protein LOC124453968 isoform X2 n=1 Tax=Xenia sp. Carnegie-2017 TaxID=2897299 RepID=UPI001F034309|nr:uncharacterized protein LOC124453968 isoform X2 [Xenia sp. Carnegie-2017]